MKRLMEDAAFVRALNEVAREQGMTLWRRHDYGADAVILFRRAAPAAGEHDPPPPIGAVMPLDSLLIDQFSRPRLSRVAIKRMLRDDLFSDAVDKDDDRPGDGVRNLRRLGLAGCHVLADFLGDEAQNAGIKVTLIPDPPMVSVATTRGVRLRLVLSRDVILLLKQFHRGERYARACIAFLRQLQPTGEAIPRPEPPGLPF